MKRENIQGKKKKKLKKNDREEEEKYSKLFTELFNTSNILAKLLLPPHDASRTPKPDH